MVLPVGGPPRRSQAIVLGAAALLFLAQPVALAAQCPDGSPPPCRVTIEPRRPTISDSVVAVLPFRTVGGEVAFWREGLVDLLAMSLDGAGGLAAVPPRQIIARLQRRPDEHLEPRAAAGLARELGAGTYVTGSVVQTGPQRVRLLLESFTTATGRKRADASFSLDGGQNDLASLADSAALMLLGRLSRVPLPLETARRRPTRSLPAMRAFLAAEQAFRGGRWDEADTYYLEAQEHDPAFALALYRRYQLRYRSQVTRAPTERELISQALQVRDRLPEREQRLLHAIRRGADYLDSSDFVARLEFTRRYPDDPEGWVWLMEWYYHAGAVYGEPWERVLEAGGMALALDSMLWTAYHHPVEIAARLGDSARAHALLTRYLRLVEPGDRIARAQELASRLRFLDADAGQRVAAGLGGESDAVLARLTRELLRFDPRISGLRVAEAIAALQVEVARSASARAGALALLGELQATRGQFSAAGRTFARALREAPNHRETALSGSTPVLVGLAPPTPEFDGAIAALAEVVEQLLASGAVDEPDGIAAVTALSRLDIARGDTSSALARSAALRHLKADLERAAPLVALDSIIVTGRVALVRGDTATAIGLLTSASRVAASGERILGDTYRPDITLLASVHLARGDTAAARNLLSRPLRAHPAAGGLLGLELLTRAEVAEKVGESAEAAARYRDVVELWSEGDPVVAPHVERARAGLRRLGEQGR